MRRAPDRLQAPRPLRLSSPHSLPPIPARREPLQVTGFGGSPGSLDIDVGGTSVDVVIDLFAVVARRLAQPWRVTAAGREAHLKQLRTPEVNPWHARSGESVWRGFYVRLETATAVTGSRPGASSKSAGPEPAARRTGIPATARMATNSRRALRSATTAINETSSHATYT